MRKVNEEFSTMSSMSITPYETFSKPHHLDKAKKFIKKIADKKIKPPSCSSAVKGGRTA